MIQLLRQSLIESFVYLLELLIRNVTISRMAWRGSWFGIGSTWDARCSSWDYFKNATEISICGRNVAISLLRSFFSWSEKCFRDMVSLQVTFQALLPLHRSEIWDFRTSLFENARVTKLKPLGKSAVTSGRYFWNVWHCGDCNCYCYHFYYSITLYYLLL